MVKLKEDRMKKPGPNDRSGATGGKSTSFDREKEELKNTIKKLEGKLSNINAAEKPLEEDKSEDHPDQDEIDKRIKTASELARWDESKKWQHKIEILRSKLTDADGEVSKLSKTNNSLRYLNNTHTNLLTYQFTTYAYGLSNLHYIIYSNRGTQR